MLPLQLATASVRLELGQASRSALLRSYPSSLATASIVMHPYAPLHPSSSGRTRLLHTTRPSLQQAVKPQQTKPQHPEGSYLLFHPVYTPEDLDSVRVTYRDAKTLGDRIAGGMVKVMRTIFDLATRYPSHRKQFPAIKGSGDARVALPAHLSQQSATAATKDDAVKGKPIASQPSTDLDGLPAEMTLEDMRKKGLTFGPDGWLTRIVFLESIAGVPGMVAATCRHLQSLRLMKRDKGWIHTMLEDAENERLHLITALTLAKPGRFMRFMVILAQGVFYPFFFTFYLLAPRVAHRFVGVLEEEAVLTYTRILEDIQAGRLPEWENVPAPEVAKEYWQLGDESKLVDVIKAIRADEATHRHINHTFASLETDDPNPFAYRDPPPRMRGENYGLERDEALEWAKGESKEQGERIG
ncbi:alternative oxidase [Violaceomyces palustris]|uniref:Alternative oxidase n=1 Tax=Violaceomyces palustris TaxID=1673888 RepID=A0ACD0NPW9_9BASI|nr:alternative oxidase [Violaceomyces palustris]